VSNTVKWVITAICGVLGIIAIIYAIIYVAVPIHSLPGFVPGKVAVNGHYHKRALIAAIIGIVLLAIAFYLGMTTQRSSASHVGSTSGSGLGSVSEDATPDAAGDEGGSVRS
jgi:uncharacterized membrane protein